MPRRCKLPQFRTIKRHCELYWLPPEILPLVNDNQFKVFGRKASEPTCLAAQDCLEDLPFILVMGGSEQTSYESFYPWQSSNNKLLGDLGPLAVLGTAAVLVQGKVMLIGGMNADGTVVKKWVHFYDVGSNSFTPASDLLEARAYLAASRLDTAVVACGGYAAVGVDLVTCEKYLDGQWSSMPSITVPRRGFQLVNVQNKLYAIAGHSQNSNSFVTVVERFDPLADSWSAMPAPLPNVRVNVAATAFEGYIIVCGGADALGQNLRSCDKYKPSTDEWSVIGQLVNAISGHHLVSFYGSLYAIAGLSTNGVEIYNPRSDSWMEVEPGLIVGGWGPIAIVV